MTIHQELQKEIDRSTVISFDIFDTLLIRPFAHPFDVFKYVEKILNLDGFYEARVKAFDAETLNEIYKRIPEKFRIAQKTEIELEIQSLTVNNEIKAVYDYAVQSHKKIIIVTDIYLPSFIIESILEKKGYTEYNYLFNSCELHARKSDGTIFPLISQKLRINPNQILHIGNDKNSDYKMALANGLRAFHYICKSERFWNDKNNSALINTYKSSPNILSSTVLGIAIINYKENNSFFYNLGFQLGSIVVYTYVSFLETILRNEKSTIFFIARDGFVLKKALEILNNNIKSNYIWAPRFIRIMGFLEGFENLEYQRTALKEFNKMGINTQDKSIIESASHQIRNEYESYLQNYYKTNQLDNKEIVIIEFTSGSASSQKLLNKYFPVKYGLYLGLGNFGITETRSFMQKDNPQLEKYQLLEFLVSSPEQPCIGFKNGSPLNKVMTETDKKITTAVKAIIEGELGFVDSINKVLGKFQINYSYTEMTEFYNNYVNNLNSEDISNFSEIYFYEDFMNSHAIPMSAIFTSKSNRKNFIKRSINKLLSLIKT